MEINDENLLPLNEMLEGSSIDNSDFVMKWASPDEDPSKISFQNFVAEVKGYIVEGFETSKTVNFFGSSAPLTGVFNNMLWLNTSDAKIYRYIQVPDVWQFVELTSPTTVYLCDMSLIQSTEDFGSYSIVILGANNWYTLSYYKGVDLLDRAEMLALINNKVDKVTGKSLILDTEITRLAGVDNYNDTELRALIDSRRAKITKTQINGTDVVLNVLGNTYYYFTNELTSLTISDVNVDEQETILEFTTGNTFVFSYPTGLYNLYGNDINNNERILIAIHNGVMEIRKKGESNGYAYKIENTIVSVWSISNAYSGYGYKSTINIADLKESDNVEVVFNLADAISGHYAPVIEQYEGYIIIFSKRNATITIPTIVIHKIEL